MAHSPPISILFAAFLGYNPIQHLAGPAALAELSAHARAVVTGQSFFPHLISAPFRDGLHSAFIFAIVACLIAAAASLLRGGRYEHVEAGVGDAVAIDGGAGIAASPNQVPQLEEQHAR